MWANDFAYCPEYAAFQQLYTTGHRPYVSKIPGRYARIFPSQAQGVLWKVRNATPIHLCDNKGKDCFAVFSCPGAADKIVIRSNA
jgi:hypothetical protein